MLGIFNLYSGFRDYCSGARVWALLLCQEIRDSSA